MIIPIHIINAFNESANPLPMKIKDTGSIKAVVLNNVKILYFIDFTDLVIIRSILKLKNKKPDYLNIKTNNNLRLYVDNRNVNAHTSYKNFDRNFKPHSSYKVMEFDPRAKYILSNNLVTAKKQFDTHYNNIKDYKHQKNNKVIFITSSSVFINYVNNICNKDNITNIIRVFYNENYLKNFLINTQIYNNSTEIEQEILDYTKNLNINPQNLQSFNDINLVEYCTKNSDKIQNIILNDKQKIKLPHNILNDKNIRILSLDDEMNTIEKHINEILTFDYRKLNEGNNIFYNNKDKYQILYKKGNMKCLNLTNGIILSPYHLTYLDSTDIYNTMKNLSLVIKKIPKIFNAVKNITKDYDIKNTTINENNTKRIKCISSTELSGINNPKIQQHISKINENVQKNDNIQRYPNITKINKEYKLSATLSKAQKNKNENINNTTKFIANTKHQNFYYKNDIIMTITDLTEVLNSNNEQNIGDNKNLNIFKLLYPKIIDNEYNKNTYSSTTEPKLLNLLHNLSNEATRNNIYKINISFSNLYSINKGWDKKYNRFRINKLHMGASVGNIEIIRHNYHDIIYNIINKMSSNEILKESNKSNASKPNTNNIYNLTAQYKKIRDNFVELYNLIYKENIDKVNIYINRIEDYYTLEFTLHEIVVQKILEHNEISNDIKKMLEKISDIHEKNNPFNENKNIVITRFCFKIENIKVLLKNTGNIDNIFVVNIKSYNFIELFGYLLGHDEIDNVLLDKNNLIIDLVNHNSPPSLNYFKHEENNLRLIDMIKTLTILLYNNYIVCSDNREDPNIDILITKIKDINLVNTLASTDFIISALLKSLSCKNLGTQIYFMIKSILCKNISKLSYIFKKEDILTLINKGINAENFHISNKKLNEFIDENIYRLTIFLHKINNNNLKKHFMDRNGIFNLDNIIKNIFHEDNIHSTSNISLMINKIFRSKNNLVNLSANSNYYDYDKILKMTPFNFQYILEKRNLKNSRLNCIIPKFYFIKSEYYNKHNLNTYNTNVLNIENNYDKNDFIGLTKNLNFDLFYINSEYFFNRGLNFNYENKNINNSHFEIIGSSNSQIRNYIFYLYNIDESRPLGTREKLFNYFGIFPDRTGKFLSRIGLLMGSSQLYNISLSHQEAETNTPDNRKNVTINNLIIENHRNILKYIEESNIKTILYNKNEDPANFKTNQHDKINFNLSDCLRNLIYDPDYHYLLNTLDVPHNHKKISIFNSVPDIIKSNSIQSFNENMYNINDENLEKNTPGECFTDGIGTIDNLSLINLLFYSTVKSLLCEIYYKKNEFLFKYAINTSISNKKLTNKTLNRKFKLMLLENIKDILSDVFKIISQHNLKDILYLEGDENTNNINITLYIITRQVKNLKEKLNPKTSKKHNKNSTSMNITINKENLNSIGNDDNRSESSIESAYEDSSDIIDDDNYLNNSLNSINNILNNNSNINQETSNYIYSNIMKIIAHPLFSFSLHPNILFNYRDKGITNQYILNLNKKIVNYLNIYFNNNIPSALQFRCFGYKGLLVLSKNHILSLDNIKNGIIKEEDVNIFNYNDSTNNTICLRDSMKKFECNLGVFEIIDYNRKSKVSGFMKQFIDSFDGIIQYFIDLVNNKDNIIYITNIINRAKDLIQYYMDTNLLEPINYTVYNSTNNRELYLKLQNTCETDIDKYMNIITNREKMKIPIQKSRCVIGVVDELNILDKGQVVLNINCNCKIRKRTSQYNNKLLKDMKPNTKCENCFTENKHALIFRLPLLNPRSIKIAKIVHREELDHFKDILIFNQNDAIPLCAELSGGDLDGDQYNVIYDDILIKNILELKSRNTEDNNNNVIHMNYIAVNQMFEKYLKLNEDVQFSEKNQKTENNELKDKSNYLQKNLFEMGHFLYNYINYDYLPILSIIYNAFSNFYGPLHFLSELLNKKIEDCIDSLKKEKFFIRQEEYNLIRLGIIGIREYVTNFNLNLPNDSQFLENILKKLDKKINSFMNKNNFKEPVENIFFNKKSFEVLLRFKETTPQSINECSPEIKNEYYFVYFIKKLLIRGYYNSNLKCNKYASNINYKDDIINISKYYKEKHDFNINVYFIQDEQCISPKNNLYFYPPHKYNLSNSMSKKFDKKLYTTSFYYYHKLLYVYLNIILRDNQSFKTLYDNGNTIKLEILDYFLKNQIRHTEYFSGRSKLYFEEMNKYIEVDRLKEIYNKIIIFNNKIKQYFNNKKKITAIQCDIDNPESEIIEFIEIIAKKSNKLSEFLITENNFYIYCVKNFITEVEWIVKTNENIRNVFDNFLDCNYTDVYIKEGKIIVP